MEMVVLRAEPKTAGNSIKSVLVEHDYYKEGGSVPADYFTPDYENAVEVGIIQVVGDTDELNTVYESGD